jgi:hypothetical protein
VDPPQLALAAPPAATARAATQAAPAAPPAAPPPPPKTTLNLPAEVDVGMRVYVGMDADERTRWAREVSLGDARISVEVRLPGTLVTVVEADLSSSRPLRDAFIRLAGPASTRLQAGRFKAPFSRRELESSWKLPLVWRGLVNDYVVKGNGLGGRQLGVIGEARPLGGRVELAGGVFSVPSASAGDPSRQDLSGSAAVKPWRGVEVGITAYRAGGGAPHLQATSAYLEATAGPAALELEGMAGRIAQGPFTAGTALLALPFEVRRGLRVGPVLGVEALQLGGGAQGNGWAATAGAVLARAEGFKVKVEGERARRPGEQSPADVVSVQLATRF